MIGNNFTLCGLKEIACEQAPSPWLQVHVISTTTGPGAAGGPAAGLAARVVSAEQVMGPQPGPWDFVLTLW